MIDDEVVNKLKKFKLSETEAKVYLYLVKMGKSTAREISSNLFIPDSKIYDVLESLQRKGFVKVEEDLPKKFIPINPRICLSNVFEEIIEELKRDKDFLINFFEKYYREENVKMEIIEGFKNIKNRICEIFSKYDKFDIAIKDRRWANIIRENLKDKIVRLIVHNDLREIFSEYNPKTFNGIFHELMIISKDSILIVLPQVGRKILSCIISDERSLEYAKEYFNSIWNNISNA